MTANLSVAQRAETCANNVVEAKVSMTVYCKYRATVRDRHKLFPSVN